MNIQTSAEDFYVVIGELEMVRRMLSVEIQKLQGQIEEMSREITRLREENDRLEQANNNQ